LRLNHPHASRVFATGAGDRWEAKLSCIRGGFSDQARLMVEENIASKVKTTHDVA